MVVDEDDDSSKSAEAQRVDMGCVVALAQSAVKAEHGPQSRRNSVGLVQIMAKTISRANCCSQNQSLPLLQDMHASEIWHGAWYGTIPHQTKQVEKEDDEVFEQTKCLFVGVQESREMK